MTAMERIEKTTLSDDLLDLVFRKARTYNAWLPKSVSDELLRQRLLQRDVATEHLGGKSKEVLGF